MTNYTERKVRGREFEEDVPWADIFDLDDARNSDD